MVGGDRISRPKNPAWGTHGPDFFCEGGKSSPGFLSGFPAGGWGGAGVGSGTWGRALGPPPRPAGLPFPWAPPSVAPQCPQEVALAAAWPCSPVTPPPPAPCPLVLRSHACPVLRVLPTFPPHQASAGVCPPPGSPPGLGPLPSLSRCQSLIPWKEWRAWPRTPPPTPRQCWPTVRRGVWGRGPLPGPWAERRAGV